MGLRGKAPHGIFYYGGLVMKYEIVNATLLKKEEIATGIFDFLLECPSVSKKALFDSHTLTSLKLL